LNTFSLLNLRSGQITPAAAQLGIINGVTFTPDGRSIVTISNNGNAVVWDAKTAQVVETLSGHSSAVVGSAISGDGQTLYTSSLDGAILAWDLSGTHRFGQSFNVSTAGPLAPRLVPAVFAVSPDGSEFAARTAPGTVGIFSIRTLSWARSFSVPPGKDIFSLAWSTNQLLAVGEDAGIELWNVRGTPVLAQHLGGVPGTGEAVAFSTDGGTVTAVTAVAPTGPQQPGDGYLGVWDTRSGHLRFSSDLGVKGDSVAIDARSGLIAAGLNEPRVLIFDLANGRLRQTIHALGQSTLALAFRADGTLVTGSWAGIVQRWDPLTGQQRDHPILAEGGPVSSLSIAPDQATFATSGSSVKLWDFETLQQFGSKLIVSDSRFGHVAYTPDGSYVLALFEDGSGGIWPASVNAWMDHACAVAHRNLTHEEWSRFVPGHVYSQVCPSFPSAS